MADVSVLSARALAPTCAILVVAGCTGAVTSDDAGAPECAAAADCGEVEAECDGCPPAGERLCLDGSCAERGEDSVDLVGDVNIEPRQLVLASMVHVIASMTTADGPLTCADVSPAGVGARVNVLAAGYKALSGGSFHQAVDFGRAPSGAVGLLLLGTSETGGDGEVLATGCALDLEATEGTLDVGVVALTGPET